MAFQTLTNQSVESTYQGVLHASGQSLPSAGITTIYDGGGQASALSIGLSSQGVAIAGGMSCSGQLTAGSIRYTTTDSASGANFPLVSDGNKNAVFGQITSNALIDLSPSPAGQFGNIQYMTVNSKGLITNIVGGTATTNAWATFDGKDVAFTYVINNLTVTCTSLVGSSINAGNIITVKDASNSSLNGSYTVQSANVNNGTFTFANPTNLTTGTGSGTIDVTIKSGYNVSSIVRESTGVYRVNFTTAYKNRDYVVLCGAKNTSLSPSDIESLQTNTVTQDKTFVRIRSFYSTNSNQVVRYDGYISVYCIGSTVDDSGAIPIPLSFDNAIATGFAWSEQTNAGVQNTVISLTPAVMAANKWNAVILGVCANINCSDGTSYANSTAVVNGATTSKIYWNSEGNSGQQVLIYNVVLYTNNKLYYKQFYNTNGGINTLQTNNTDVSDGAATSLIYNGLAAQGMLPGYYGPSFVNANVNSSGAWLANFISNYSNSLVEVNSVDLTLYTFATNGGQCNGGFFSQQNLTKYYTS